MCIGESTGDTLGTAELAMIRDVAAIEFGAHDVALHRNDDGIEWMVLSPRGHTDALLRFTICRIDPAVMVLVEDCEKRRQIRSVPDVAAALDVVRCASNQALGATGAKPRHLH
jgi:hypothetical protein